MYEPTYNYSRSKRLGILFPAFASVCSVLMFRLMDLVGRTCFETASLVFFLIAVPLLTGRYVIILKELGTRKKWKVWFRMPMHYGGLLAGYIGLIIMLFGRSTWIGVVFLVSSALVIFLIEKEDWTQNQPKP